MANSKTYPYTDDAGVLHIRYQDTYTFTHTVLGIEDVQIISKITGTDTPDPNLLLLREDGKSVYADGCGTATVRTCIGEVKVQVDPSPLNLLFVTGQSNASGDPARRDPCYYESFLLSPETMAYYTFCGQQVSIDVEGDKALYRQAIDEDGCTLWHTKEMVANGDWSMPNFADYRLNVTATLDWETAYAAKGCDPKVFTSHNTTFSNSGWNAALASEWVKQTGERVWIVNCSQGGMEIQQFEPSEDGTVKNNEYYQAVAVFNLALETLYKEVDAGHFTLHHMAYYWYQGESNGLPYPENASREYYGYENRFKQDRGFRYLDSAQYIEKFTKMHEGFMRDVVYDHNGVRHELEFCGIMTIRYKVGPEYSYSQIGINGIRAAQYYIGACEEGSLANVFVASNVTEKWVGETVEEAGQNIAAYFTGKYGSPEAFEEKFGYKMPSSYMDILPNSPHYLMYAHNEMGLDCARNTLLYINETQPTDGYALSYNEEDVVISLFGKDGRTEMVNEITFDADMTAVVCPKIAPLYLIAEGLELTLDEGYEDAFSLDGYILKCLDKTREEVSLTLRYAGAVYATYALRVKFA